MRRQRARPRTTSLAGWPLPADTPLGKRPDTTGPWYPVRPPPSTRAQPLLKMSTLGVVAAQLQGPLECGPRLRVAAGPEQQLAAHGGQPVAGQVEAVQERQTRERAVG